MTIEEKNVLFDSDDAKKSTYIKIRPIAGQQNSPARLILYCVIFVTKKQYPKCDVRLSKLILFQIKGKMTLTYIRYMSSVLV